ncbi:hypothetical protein [Haloferula sp. BvORR071]|uniref:hypothetical protein n=1 Tax=Haloferula sp. BvORR071 TaxID=1396141 RepID=UPI00055235C0|nr:hypothetical protein [Haloferula sp. BvORR071]
MPEADDNPNPYSPPAPAADLPEAEPGRMWSVEGGYLMLRPGAMLPPVALEGEGEILTPGMRRFAVFSGGKGILMFALPMLATIGWMLYSKIRLHGDYLWAGLLVIFLLLRLVRSQGGGLVNAMVWGFFPVAHLQAKARRERWVKRLTLLGLALLFGAWGILVVRRQYLAGLHYSARGNQRFQINDTLEWLLPTVGLALLILIAAAVWKSLKPGLRCTAYRNGWLYLRGVPDASLTLLAAKAGDERPPLRKRMVVKFYQHRLPWSVLLGPHWLNPWLLFWLAVFKLGKSPRLERLRFPENDYEGVPEADPELLARWHQETAGTGMASWTLASWQYRDSPQGDLRVCSLSFASPDWTSFASLIVTRLSVMQVYAESRLGMLQSWTEDGQFIVTANPPAFFAIPSHMDCVEMKGSLVKLLEAHARRTAGMTLTRVSGEKHLRELFKRELETVNAVYEAKGFQSAPEEMELRDFPA